MIKQVISRLTMRRISCHFVDVVSGEEVFNYVDCYGVKWLANWNYLTGMRMKKESTNERA